MIDIQIIRDNPELVKEKSRQKGYDVDIDKLLYLDSERKGMLGKIEDLRQKRNEIAAQMKGGKPEQTLIEQGKAVKEQLSELESNFSEIDSGWISLLKQVPNMPTEDVPIGESEDENVVVKEHGAKPDFDFKPLRHALIAENKGWLDKERAAKVAGSRFAYVKGDMVRMQFAIIQFIMDKVTDEEFIASIVKENNLSVETTPFVPILPPYIIRTDIYDAMDRLEPRDDRYKIEGEDLWLQGSAEHVIGSMHAGEILDEQSLPLRYIGYATSFRREAGTYGKDMEGLFRMHQFDKLELESFSTKEKSLNEHLLLVAIQEKIMQLLGIPYQLLNKCTADIGKPNARGVDINAWLPGQGQYRETHTADYMTDYQSRRLKTRVRRSDGSVELLHTNDATAIPLSRGPIAIIENYQTADGDVRVPDVLKPYMSGKELI